MSPFWGRLVCLKRGDIICPQVIEHTAVLGDAVGIHECVHMAYPSTFQSLSCPHTPHTVTDNDLTQTKP